MPKMTPARRPLLRRRSFWVTLSLVLVPFLLGGVYFIKIWQSAQGPDIVGLDVWRHDGPGPNGTYELTDADLARLHPAFAQAFAAANATGHGEAWPLAAEEMRAFHTFVHVEEHYHDALTQRYQPLGNYVRYHGVAYRYSFTTV